jgi:hypothetical protein
MNRNEHTEEVNSIVISLLKCSSCFINECVYWKQNIHTLQTYVEDVSTKRRACHVGNPKVSQCRIVETPCDNILRTVD